MALKYMLYEHAAGYALFDVKEAEVIGASLDTVQEAVKDVSKFSKSMVLISFMPFKNAAEALQNCNDVSEGVCSEALKNFLDTNLPKKSKKRALGVAEKNLAGAIKQECGIECVSDDVVAELVRGIRLHTPRLIKQLEGGNVLEKAQLGLGHAYSRAKVKFNVNRSDTMITQAICLLDKLDKDINTFAMRVREWYGWHFPELVKICPDNITYARLARFIQSKSNLTDEALPELEQITQDAVKAKYILDASRSSMGTEISELDILNIKTFADRVVSLAEYRTQLHTYLKEKMNYVAPNLAALIGEVVGARLISHAGSLTNLSKYPASTVQILGAEKALFRALKTRGNTPKYGLIYHSTFIGKAGLKNKGRVSRYLANKCSVASRIDCFSDKPTSKFGEALRKQVEDRLEFYEHGGQMKTNTEVMAEVIKELGEDESEVIIPKAQATEAEKKEKKEKKDKKRKHEDADGEVKSEKKKKKSEDVAEDEKKKEKKKSKKDKKKSESSN